MKLNIRAKLLMAFTLVLILSSAVNIYGLLQMNILAELTTKIYNHPLQVTRAVLSANTEIIKMHRGMKDVALSQNEVDIETAHKMVTQYEQNVYQQFTIVKQWILGQEGAKLIAETIQTFRDWAPIREEVIALMKQSKRAQASAITKGKGADHVLLLDSKMEALKNYAAHKANGMYQSAQTTKKTVITTTLLALIIVIIASALLIFFLSHSIVNSVRIIKTVAQQMVAGEVAATVQNQTMQKEIIAYQDEMGDIGRAFFAVADYFKTVIGDIVQISQGLAEGNLHVKAKADYRGDFVQIQNALETASSDLWHVIEDIVQVSQSLAQGDKHVMSKAEYRGDFVQIKEALETASTKLTAATTRNLNQDWLKTGQTQLNDKMSGEQEQVKLTSNIIAFLANYLDMQLGILYLFQEAKDQRQARLKVIASYAYNHRQGLKNEFKIGEGLVGQAALEKETIHLTKVPENYYVRIQSGLGKALPKNVLIQPFFYEETLKGVIELATFQTITELQLDFLNQVMPNIGIAINTAQSRSRMQILLQESQKQTEELQSQSEELQSQSEELQTQQEELRQTNEELEEQTRELERQKQDVQTKNLSLEQAQTDMEKAKLAIETKAKELELASKYKSEFLANMSHELRTPLNSLLILAQMLGENKEGNLTDKQMEYAKTIFNSGSDLLTLINEILDLSKVEAGKIEIHVENVRLKDLVDMVNQKFNHVAEPKGIAFPITVADDLPSSVKTDGHRLQQIINNLLSNAFKFTNEGEVRLTIQRPTPDFAQWQTQSGNNELDPAKTIAFSVTDTGIGIPKDKQMLIFEAFQQVDGTTSRRYGGTGLGLSISRQLARILGGDLHLQSEEGQGSTFTLYLAEHHLETVPNSEMFSLANLAKPEPQSSDDQLSQIVQEQKILKSLETPDDSIMDDRSRLTPEDKTLLIIEDDREFATLLMTTAWEKDFKCIMAEDGKTGLQYANQYHPHAIILDVGLPQLDGWTVMEKLKENPETRHIPVHFMSASEKARDAKQMGAIGYLLKPINLDELGDAFTKIEQFITKKIKEVLIIADNEQHQQALLKIILSENVQTKVVSTLAQTRQELQDNTFDALILDVEVEQQSGLNLLEQLQQQDELFQAPIIIYAKRDLTEAEDSILQKFAKYFTLKTVCSPERLLEEATLFLHQVEEHLPSDKQKMLQMVHNKDAILAHKKILLVDDDVRNTFALMSFLERKQMEVFVGENGKEALTVLDEHPDISIVLMDIMMPEMDGYEAIQEIRKQTRFRKLPIIALTAKAMKGDKIKCIEAGASDYLAKPVDTEKLVSLMRVWLYR
jgi:signal transduction histidine kinase/DNA-binding response OmpR family regulator/methyl-accepting chemotaxis protein